MVILKQEILEDEGVDVKQEEDPLYDYQDNLVIDVDDKDDDLEPPGEEKETVNIDKMFMSKSERYCLLVNVLCVFVHMYLVFLGF